MAEVIYEAWQRGAKFDAWKDQLNYQAWLDAFDNAGIKPDFYTHRDREVTEKLPWDHISTTVRKNFMVQDLLRLKESNRWDQTATAARLCASG
jgi:hypothetical protein